MGAGAKVYLTTKQMLIKHPFLSGNMIKNLLTKNIGCFREKVVRKLGRRLLFDEQALLKYIENNDGDIYGNIS